MGLAKDDHGGVPNRGQSVQRGPRPSLAPSPLWGHLALSVTLAHRRPGSLEEDPHGGGGGGHRLPTGLRRLSQATPPQIDSPAGRVSAHLTWGPQALKLESEQPLRQPWLLPLASQRPSLSSTCSPLLPPGDLSQATLRSS